MEFSSANIESLIKSGRLELPFDDLRFIGAGEGGFSFVFQARCRRRAIPVALKFVAPDLASREPLRYRAFKREADVLEVLLGKENVVQLAHPLESHELSIETPELGKLTMRIEYFGLAYYPATLLKLIRESGNSLDTLLRAFRDVVKGVRQVHSASVCHRDLKPANCLVDDEHAVIGDFGCAKRNTAEDSLRNGDQYNLLIWGATRYVAPECFCGATTFQDFIRADYYALGAMLYELCTGEILGDRIHASLDVFGQMNASLRRDGNTVKRRKQFSTMLRSLELTSPLPLIPLQPPIPNSGIRDQLQRLFEALCAFDSAKRLVDNDTILKRIDSVLRAMPAAPSAGPPGAKK